MNKFPKNIWILVACVAVLLFGILYFHFKSYIPKYRWNENYDADNVQPYGLKLAVDVVSATCSKSDFFLINKPVHDYITKTDTGALYIFIGENYVCDSALSQNLIDFVHRGNNAFISSIGSEHFLFTHLTNKLHSIIYYHYINDSLINVKFESDTSALYNFNFRQGLKTTKYKWLGLDSTFLSDTLGVHGFEPVSRIGFGLADCIRVKHGRGWFVFQTNPLFFTNYHLAKENGYRYLNKLLSDYKKNKVLWDEFSKSGMDNTSITSTQESPLRFILSEKSLRWAWYMIVALILIFLIFNSKRKQVQIPLMPHKKNTTVEFVNSIAMLYYKNNSHAFVAEEMMKQFLSFIKYKYGISTGLDKKKIPKLLAPLSRISENHLEQLFEYYSNVIYSPEIDTKSLVHLHSHIENFYQNCK